MAAKPRPIKPSVPGSGTAAATNRPLEKANPPAKSPDPETKSHFEQKRPPEGNCRTKVVKSFVASLPAWPESGPGIAAGTHAENVARGWAGKVKPPRMMAET